MKPHRPLTWSRLAAITATALCGLYLSGTGVLWAYYTYSREIPGVHWHDIVWLPRFDRVHQAVGAHHLAKARRLWESGEYANGLYFGRVALAKRPTDPETRLFLAQCWLAVGRPGPAAQLLEEGLAFDSTEQPLAHQLIECYIASGRWTEILTLQQQRLPALGRTPPAADAKFYRVAAIRSTLETVGAERAATLVAEYPELEQDPAAAPLLARIDVDRLGVDPALARLRRALLAQPANANLHNALIDIALNHERPAEARQAAEAFAQTCHDCPDAALRILEVHASRAGDDRLPWLQGCMRYLSLFRKDADALESLANLAARKGWSDLALLLYENSLVSINRDRNFAFCYVGSLVANREYAQAQSVWNDLVEQKIAGTDTAPVLAAMIAAGNGREGDALEQVERLRLSTKDDPQRRQRLAALLRDFGFAPLASSLTTEGPNATRS